jgi:murein DD-endopeptidase MepM/ murein hydrolase activator NlpD
MPSLKENVSYQPTDKMNKLFAPAVKSAYSIGNSLRKKSPKTVDISQYQGIADRVSGKTSGLNEGQQTSLGTVTTPYGGSTNYESYHPGVDLANKMGTAIKSLNSGVVTESVIGKKQGDPGYGNFLTIKDDAGNSFRYSHLQNSYLPVGTTVNRGQEIGTMGNSGQTYSVSNPNNPEAASHVDIRIKNIYGKYVNPSSYIN